MYGGVKFGDACRHIIKKKFCPFAGILVKFANDNGRSEEEVDVGGPHREFMRLYFLKFGQTEANKTRGYAISHNFTNSPYCMMYLW